MINAEKIIYTTKGDIVESLLDKTSGTEENESQILYWTEYRLKGTEEKIRRSCRANKSYYRF